MYVCMLRCWCLSWGRNCSGMLNIWYSCQVFFETNLYDFQQEENLYFRNKAKIWFFHLGSSRVWNLANFHWLKIKITDKKSHNLTQFFMDCMVKCTPHMLTIGPIHMNMHPEELELQINDWAVKLSIPNLLHMYNANMFRTVYGFWSYIHKI